MNNFGVPNPSFGQIVKETFTRPFTWAARSTRKSFWIGILLIAIVTSLVFSGTFPLYSNVFNSLKNGSVPLNSDQIYTPQSLIGNIVLIYLYLCHLGLTIRRFHDTGRSGWWYWIAVIPIIGYIWFFVILLLPTKTKSVKWGTYL